MAESQSASGPRHPARRPLHWEQDAALFLTRWLKAPHLIGAVAPSSRGLGRAMAREVDVGGAGIVVELGGGTGSITRALLERGLAPDHLIVVERDRTLAALLRKRFPGVRIVRGDACELTRILAPLAIAAVDAVVSSLPLLSMPKRARHCIVAESFALLGEYGTFIQFTYGVASPLAGAAFGLAGEPAKRVWANFPPAVVWRYRRAPAPIARVA